MALANMLIHLVLSRIAVRAPIDRASNMCSWLMLLRTSFHGGMTAVDLVALSMGATKAALMKLDGSGGRWTCVNNLFVCW